MKTIGTTDAACEWEGEKKAVILITPLNVREEMEAHLDSNGDRVWCGCRANKPGGAAVLEPGVEADCHTSKVLKQK